MDQLGGELADLQQGVARHIRLCASTAGLTQFLPPLLTRYSQAHPQVRVDLEELVSDEVVAQLRDGRADVGVFVQGPDTAGLNTRDFRQDELVLVLPAGHRLLGKAPLAFVAGPLAGLKVLELGQLIAGPFAAKTLADFGADVVKIEPPGAGDPLRKWRLLKDGTSVWWQVQSRNKRSVALDLRDPEAQDIVRKLAPRPTC
jgi:DNA-binding transcriptional LysR family regulator